MMSEQIVFQSLITGWLVLAGVVFLVLFFVAAPYGRHFRGGWGPAIGNRLGWVIMEAPAPIVFAACFALRRSELSVTLVCLLLMWEAHYVHRAFISVSYTHL
ncbi:MAG: hypothetical protein N2506_07850, partial [Dehalococcoidales bacterium]|nr:hypothetical protein [Dehalococcoidales bacterium]